MAPSVQRRQATLDGLRAISILLVLGTHLLPLGPSYLRLNEAAGAMGMSLFFALSGYLIIRTAADGGVGDFIVRRLARLLPLAWLYGALIVVLHPMSGEAMLATLGLFLNYRPDLMVPQTEHLWSLGVEVHFYAAIALLMLGPRRLLFLVWPLCLAVTLLRVAEGAHLSIATHLRVDEILIGACVGTLSADALARRATPRWLWPAAAAALCLASHPESGPLQFLRPYFAGLVLAATLTLPAGLPRRILASGPARYIATISYALYVIHPLTAHGWWNAGSLAERYLFKRPLGLAITFVLAHLSTFYWERLFTDAARRRLASRKERADRRAAPPLARIQSPPDRARG